MSLVTPVVHLTANGRNISHTCLYLIKQSVPLYMYVGKGSIVEVKASFNT